MKSEREYSLTSMGIPTLSIDRLADIAVDYIYRRRDTLGTIIPIPLSEQSYLGLCFIRSERELKKETLHAFEDVFEAWSQWQECPLTQHPEIRAFVHAIADHPEVWMRSVCVDVERNTYYAQCWVREVLYTVYPKYIKVTQTA
jgi:hypothetical protein